MSNIRIVVAGAAGRMGRALVRDPLLFLFDEPLSNLDAKLRVEMRALVGAHFHLADIALVPIGDAHLRLDAEQRIARKAGLSVAQRMGEVDEFHKALAYLKCLSIFARRNLTDSRRSSMPSMPSSMEIQPWKPTEFRTEKILS